MIYWSDNVRALARNNKRRPTGLVDLGQKIEVLGHVPAPLPDTLVDREDRPLIAGPHATIRPTRLPGRRSYFRVMCSPKHAFEPNEDNAEHIVRCTICGGYFDLCDATQVFNHLGPLPHPAEAQPQ
jgi:hypothetical protein